MQPRTVLDAMEQNRELLDTFSGLNSLAEQSQQLDDAFSGLNSVAEQCRRLADAFSGHTEMVEQCRRLAGSISDSASFGSLLDANKTLVQLAAQPDFASMIGTATMPRAQWAGVLDGLSGPIAADLYYEAAREFETAASLAGEGDGATWWVFHLPLGVQLALLVPVLEIVNAMSEFMADLAGGPDLPPAYRSGTQVLFNLATVLVVVLNAKVNALADDEDSD